MRPHDNYFMYSGSIRAQSYIFTSINDCGHLTLTRRILTWNLMSNSTSISMWHLRPIDFSGKSAFSVNNAEFSNVDLNSASRKKRKGHVTALNLPIKVNGKLKILVKSASNLPQNSLTRIGCGFGANPLGWLLKNPWGKFTSKSMSNPHLYF